MSVDQYQCFACEIDTCTIGDICAASKTVRCCRGIRNVFPSCVFGLNLNVLRSPVYPDRGSRRNVLPMGSGCAVGPGCSSLSDVLSLAHPTDALSSDLTVFGATLARQGLECAERTVLPRVITLLAAPGGESRFVDVAAADLAAAGCA